LTCKCAAWRNLRVWTENDVQQLHSIDVDAIANNSVDKLNLSKLSNLGAEIVSKALMQNKSISEIDLSSNSLEEGKGFQFTLLSCASCTCTLIAFSN
jgi:hypothetical protein